MITTSKINLINKNNPTIKIQEQGKKKLVEIANYLVKQGDKIKLLSCCSYVGKLGYFFCCINEKNETFMLDSSEIYLNKEKQDLFIKEYFANPTFYDSRNKTPLFKEEPLSQLDL
jgi:hypothetical protein